MNTRSQKNNRFLSIFILGLCLLFSVGVAAADEEKVTAVDTGDGLPYQNDGVIMTIDVAGSYMVIHEKKVEVTQYKKGDQILNTTLTDLSGKPVVLAKFKEGQRVHVVGFLMPDNTIVAESIAQVKSGHPGGNKRPPLRELEPIQ